jgi:hypothetical protein
MQQLTGKSTSLVVDYEVTHTHTQSSRVRTNEGAHLQVKNDVVNLTTRLLTFIILKKGFL